MRRVIRGFAIVGLVACWLVYIVTQVLHIWFRKPFEYGYSDLEFTCIILAFAFFLPLLAFGSWRD